MAFELARTRCAKRCDPLLDLLAVLRVDGLFEVTLERRERAFVLAQAVGGEPDVEQQLGPSAQLVRVLERDARVVVASRGKCVAALLERALGRAMLARTECVLGFLLDVATLSALREHRRCLQQDQHPDDYAPTAHR